MPRLPQLQSAQTRRQPSPSLARRPPPPEPWRPQGGNKSVSAASGVLGAGRLLPAPVPTPSRAALRSASRGAEPAQETLRTCPGSQDSGGSSESSQLSELGRPATTEGKIRGSVAQFWAAAVRVVLALSRAHPRPLPLAQTHALTLWVGRLPRRRLPLLSLPLPSSCWPETHFASARHPESSRELSSRTDAAELPPPPPAPAPGLEWLARSPPARALLPAHRTLFRRGCPRLYEVPLLQEGNVKHHARLISAINNVCAEHDFSDELTHGVLQALINSVTLVAPPPGGQKRVASFYMLSFLASSLGF